MKKHTDFSAPGTTGANVLRFPSDGKALQPAEPLACDDQVPDGMPNGFLLLEDGIYQDRPGEGDDMVPVRICSSFLATVRCRRPGGSDWGAWLW